MKTQQKLVLVKGNKKLLSLSLAAILAGTSVSAFASGFQLFEENGSGIANFGAGGAAEAADASTGFYNPAGLTRIKNWQVVFAGTGIWARTNFNGTSSTSLLANGVQVPGLPPLFTGAGSSSGDISSLVPAAHFAAPINDRAVFGIGVTAPFGLETKYDGSAFTRYYATDTKVQVININPNVGIKLNNNFSVGAGLDVQEFSARLESVTGLGNRVRFDTDSISSSYAHDWRAGWNAGVLFTTTDQNTRAGLSFRSQVKHHATGGSTLTGPITPLINGRSSPIFTPRTYTDVTLPSTTMASIWHRLNDRWAVMGTVVYTNWSVFQNLVLNNIAGAPINLNTGLPRTVDVPQHFRNTWRVAGGADYSVTDKLTLRTGLGWDESPTNDTDRNIRLPGGDRIALAFGASYQATKHARFDIGYTHLFIRNAVDNVTQPYGSIATTTTGSSTSSADLLGAQITYDI